MTYDSTKVVTWGREGSKSEGKKVQRFSAIFDLTTMSDDFYPITSDIWGPFRTPPPSYPKIRRHLWTFPNYISITLNLL